MSYSYYEPLLYSEVLPSVNLLRFIASIFVTVMGLRELMSNLACSMGLMSVGMRFL